MLHKNVQEALAGIGKMHVFEGREFACPSTFMHHKNIETI